MTPSLALLECYAPLTPVKECPPLVAHQSGEIFALWQAWERERAAVCDVPYWALVWPAAQVLAQYLGENHALVRGKAVLDCGCGGGVAAIAAAAGGARRALGCDLDPAAIAVAKLNGAANGAAVEFVRGDILPYCDARQFELILAADLFYEREFSRALFAALASAHARGCAVIIADSGRPFLPKESLREIYARTVPTSVEVEGRRERTVRLFRFS